ncbi:serine/threonine protein kinase [Coprinopsis cinerea AmutBmut pab1-1]|nr:serine/threonine protein kinase [Coprinopsis cinerea AmutBmut pab1-1]
MAHHNKSESFEPLETVSEWLPKSKFFKALTTPFDYIPMESLKSLKRNSNGEACPPMASHIKTARGRGHYSIPIWTSGGPWKWAQGLPLVDSRIIFAAEPHPFNHTKEWYGLGFLGDELLQFMCRTWDFQSEGSMARFIADVALNKALLYPLHGKYVSTIIGIYAGNETAHVVTEVPHRRFWVAASPDMPEALKRRCIEAYEHLHSRGILHGNVGLDKIAIGGDGRVTLLDFSQAKAIEPVRDCYMAMANPGDLRMELRKVKCLLNFQDAVEKERDKHNWQYHRTCWNSEEQEKQDIDPNYVPDLQDIPEEERLDPPVDVDLEGWVAGPDYIPDRFVVPGTSPEQYAIAVGEFYRLALEMEEKDKTPTPSPSSSSFSSGSTAPSPSWTLRQAAAQNLQATEQPSLAETTAESRKRKAGSTESESETPSKRMRTLGAHETVAAGPSRIVAESSHSPGILKVTASIHPSIMRNNLDHGMPMIKVIDFAHHIPPPRARVPNSLEEKDSPSTRSPRSSSENRRPPQKRVAFSAGRDTAFKRYKVPRSMWHYSDIQLRRETNKRLRRIGSGPRQKSLALQAYELRKKVLISHPVERRISARLQAKRERERRPSVVESPSTGPTTASLQAFWRWLSDTGSRLTTY